jgi:hypothetical protein
MAVCLPFHIPSQLQGLVLYGDCTDLQGRSKASDIGGGGGYRRTLHELQC